MVDVWLVCGWCGWFVASLWLLYLVKLDTLYIQPWFVVGLWLVCDWSVDCVSVCDWCAAGVVGLWLLYLAKFRNPVNSIMVCG